MKNKRFEFPRPLKEAIKGLDNESRWKIIEYLTENGESSYSTLLNDLKVENKGILTFHLQELSKGALINRYEIFGNTTKKRSFYDISSFGKNMINNLMLTFSASQKAPEIIGAPLTFYSGLSFLEEEQTREIPYSSGTGLASVSQQRWK